MLGTSPLGGRALGGSAVSAGPAKGIDTHDGFLYLSRDDWRKRRAQPEEPAVEPIDESNEPDSSSFVIPPPHPNPNLLASHLDLNDDEEALELIALFHAMGEYAQ